MMTNDTTQLKIATKATNDYTTYFPLLVFLHVFPHSGFDIVFLYYGNDDDSFF